MKQRTCNIIMACKGNCKYAAEGSTLINSVKIYLGKECDYPWKKYTDGQIRSILLEALYDFINGADNPEFELRQLFYQYPFEDPSLNERICIMFELTQVREAGQYVNGFTKELIDQSDIDLGVRQFTDAWTNQLSPRTVNCLKRAYICSIEDLTSKSVEEIKAIPNFTMKNVNEVLDFLKKNGLTLKA